MGLLTMFGVGADKIAGQNRHTVGRVTEETTCWWFKVNTKPVRMGPMDGAQFPHIIRFTYEVEGKTYEGRRWVAHYLRCPQVGENITVFYDGENPGKYAVKL